MGPIKIQDIQNAVNLAQNRTVQQLSQTMLPKQDLQLMNNNIKALVTLVQQNQQYLRQSEYQILQWTRRTAAMEARIAQLEQEVKWTRSLLEKVSNRQPQVVVTPQQDQDGYGRPSYVFQGS